MTKPTRPPVVDPEVPVSDPAYAGIGYPRDPQIMLAISKDGGQTWSDWVPRSMGKIGEYRARVAWHRLGSSDKLVLKFALSDPAPLTVLDLDVTLEGGRR